MRQVHTRDAAVQTGSVPEAMTEDAEDREETIGSLKLQELATPTPKVKPTPAPKASSVVRQDRVWACPQWGT